MTAQLSRIVYRIGSPENDQHHFTEQKDHADIAKNNGYEVSEYVLAGLGSEPVAKVETVGVCWYADNGVPRKPAVGAALYAAPPAPVAVPDERAAFESFMGERFGDCIDRRQVKNSDGEYMAWDMLVAWIVWQRRASMLKAGPVTAATVPDGWKLVPVEPTKEMMLHKSGCQHHAWDDAECSMRQTRRLVWAHMIAAAPSAPEQEV